MWWSSPLCVNLNLNGGSGCSPAAVSERGKNNSEGFALRFPQISSVSIQVEISLKCLLHFHIGKQLRKGKTAISRVGGQSRKVDSRQQGLQVQLHAVRVCWGRQEAPN